VRPGLRSTLAWVWALVAAALLASGTVAFAAPPQLPARAWVLIDARDGEVLAAHRAHTSLPVASTTKLMTALVARRALDLEELVVALGYVPASPAESLLGLREGERIRTRDLLYGLLLASGNDAAEALAVAAAGSEAAFVARMTRAAAALGLDETSYANPIGLDQPGNYSSARDLVELARELRADPFFREVLDTPEAELRSGAGSRTVVNRNNLVRTVPYVNGVKTGYTLGAGNVLVGSGERNGIELISAVLGVASESERDAATLELLEYGFSRYRRKDVLSAGDPIAGVPVRDQDRTLGMAPVRDVRLTFRKGQRIGTEVDAPAEVEGPVARGERLAVAVVTVDGDRAATVGLGAVRSVPAATVLQRFDAAVPGPRVIAWLVAIGGLALLFAGGLAIYDRRRG
jgi:D-alanyl-D-alanine carboxypeptidase (penicillin-binding protein 5/6)